VDQVLTREMTNITIVNPDGGQYALGFVDPVSSTLYVGPRLHTNFTAWEFNVAVRDFYSKYYGAGIDVQKIMYAADGSVTRNALMSVKSVYTIYVLRSLNSATCKQITVQKISTSATITAQLPKDVQLSNPTMTGAFKIKCTLKDGVSKNTTIDIYS